MTDLTRLLAARGIRAFADGCISLLLPFYLIELGFDAFRVGAIATATLLGSGLFTLALGAIGHRYRRHRLFVAAALLMAATGIGFAGLSQFWPLMLVAFVGTLNPSNGDVSVFLPLEQAALAHIVDARRRTAVFAWYSTIGSLLGAGGALAAAAPDWIAAASHSSRLDALRFVFLAYAACGLLAGQLYRGLGKRIGEASAPEHAAPLTQSRTLVYRLALLFSLDSFGGGFVVQSLLALWLFQRFGLSAGETAQIFFWTGICSALSYLAAVPIARKLGLINTMVFTHLPANVCLILVPFIPHVLWAVVLLVVRSALSQIDVPARRSYVMAVVAAEERTAAASVTSVPRSLAAAASPALAGWLLTLSGFGWPLVIGGGLKIVYDLLLLLLFRKVRPPEESDADQR